MPLVELIGDRLARYIAGRGNRRNAINVNFTGRALRFICEVDGRRRGVRARARDRALGGLDGLSVEVVLEAIGDARRVVPIRIVVAKHAEIGAAGDLDSW